MALTEEQRKAGNEVIMLLRKGEKRIKLIGSAGTGKTFLVSELLGAMLKDRTINTRYNNGQIFATAPTNKALAVLQSKIKYSVNFATIHSALKLKRIINRKTGYVSFVPGYSKDNSFKNCKAAAIDETSMLNSDFVGGIKDGKQVQGYLENLPFPIIFIGDNKQLNPVGESISPIWMKDYPTVELTEIIRQGAGNPIIELSRDLDMIYFKTPHLIEGKGYTYNDNQQQIIDDLAEVNGTDEMKYLSFTNSDIDAVNKAVRTRIYGNPRKIELGEVLVFDSPHAGHYTNKEVKVESLDIVSNYVNVPNSETKFIDSMPTNKLDRIKLKYYRINDSFNIIHEDSEDIFRLIHKELIDNAKKYSWNWVGVYYFVEQFAEITYNHAITIHKSQGSTYKQTIINIQNVNFNKNIAERDRLLYTAVTRASDLVILNNVK